MKSNKETINFSAKKDKLPDSSLKEDDSKTYPNNKFKKQDEHDPYSKNGEENKYRASYENDQFYHKYEHFGMKYRAKNNQPNAPNYR